MESSSSLEALAYPAAATFDAAAAFAWGCTVHMFDHTIPPPAQRILANLHKVSVSVTATCNPL